MSTRSSYEIAGQTRYTDLFDFAGTTVVVTGAANGIGAACAHRFTEAGASVVLVDRDADATQRVAAQLPGALALPLDVTARGAAEEIAAAAVAHGGRFAALVNSAGRFPHYPPLEMPEQDWDDVMALNLRAVFATAQACAREMLAAGGAIVNLASVAAIRPRPGMTAYSASKGAVVSFTKALSLDVGPTVRVNAVAPGPITDTAGARAGLPQDLDQAAAAIAAAGKRLPIGRTGTADDVARLILFLASDAAGFITGETVTIDGGSTLV